MKNNVSDNIVTITGPIVSIKSREGVTKAGKPYLSADVVVRVHQQYLGIDETSDIKVSFFATKFTNAGQSSQSYEQILELLNKKTIIKDGIGGADRVCLTRASINENSYVGRNGLVSSWDLSGRFVNNPTKVEDAAVFSVDFVVLNKRHEIDADGEETGRLVIQAGIVGRNDTLSVVDIFVDDPNNASQIDSEYEEGDTVNGWGRIRVVTKEQKRKVSTSSWGEDAPGSVTTRTIRELVLTGCNPILDDGFDKDYIKNLCSKRKAEREQMVMNGSAVRQAAPQPQAKPSYAWA